MDAKTHLKIKILKEMMKVAVKYSIAEVAKYDEVALFDEKLARDLVDAHHEAQVIAIDLFKSAVEELSK